MYRVVKKCILPVFNRDWPIPCTPRLLEIRPYLASYARAANAVVFLDDVRQARSAQRVSAAFKTPSHHPDLRPGATGRAINVAGHFSARADARTVGAARGIRRPARRFSDPRGGGAQNAAGHFRLGRWLAVRFTQSGEDRFVQRSRGQLPTERRRDTVTGTRAW